MRITIESKVRDNEAQEKDKMIYKFKPKALVSVINLIDLAGSESGSYTNTKSKEQKEMRFINTVLWRTESTDTN